MVLKQILINIGFNFGWDKGQEIKVIELYYNFVGSHIRPKLETDIPNDKTVMQYISKALSDPLI